MKKLIILAALTLASPAFAAELSINTMLGTGMTEIRQNLTGMGYDVRKSELEHGRIEVYVVKGNQRLEVYVNQQTGKVTRLKNK